MPISPIAIAADYADAMLTARRAKNLLFALLLLILMVQVGIFLAVRQNREWLHPQVKPPAAMGAPTDVLISSLPATRPLGDSTISTAQTPTTIPLNSTDTISTERETPPNLYLRFIEYLVPMTGFFGIVFAVLLCMVQLLLVQIMLVGRLVGVSKVTGAFLWTLLLILLLFPWQSVLISPVNSNTLLSTSGISAGYEFKIPGVIYTLDELAHPILGANFDGNNLQPHVVYLRWARFVIWPCTAIIVLLLIQVKSSSGLRLALGESVLDDSRKN